MMETNDSKIIDLIFSNKGESNEIPINATNLNLIVDAINSIFDKVYPIGSIYISMSNVDPGSLFGGNWNRIAQGKTLIGLDENDDDFNEIGKTGGSKFMQKHSHNFVGVNGIGSYNQLYTSGTTLEDAPGVNKGGKSYSAGAVKIAESGDGNSGNVPPYITCYIWQRIS